MIARLLRSARRLVPTALLALTAASPAIACTCLPTPSVEDSKAASQALFTGIPISIESAGSGQRVTFQVTAIWKGVVPAQYSVYAGDPAMCGVDFTLGEEWLVERKRVDEPLLAEREVHAAHRGIARLRRQLGTGQGDLPLGRPVDSGMPGD